MSKYESLLGDLGKAIDEEIELLRSVPPALPVVPPPSAAPEPVPVPEPTPTPTPTPVVPVPSPPSVVSPSGSVASVPAVGGFIQVPYEPPIGYRVSSQNKISSQGLVNPETYVVNTEKGHTSFKRPYPVFTATEDYTVYVSPTGSDASGSGGRSAPYQSIRKAVTEALKNCGSTKQPNVICLHSGNYNIGNAGVIPRAVADRWVKVQAASNLAASEVRISSGELDALRVCYRGVTLTSTLISGMNRGSGAWLWCDGCVLTGRGRDIENTRLVWNTWDKVWLTNCELHHSCDGVYNVQLAYRVKVRNLGNDVFIAPQKTNFMAVEIDVLDLKNIFGKHADLVQWGGGAVKNCLLADVQMRGNNKATLVGIYANNPTTVDGLHFDNCYFEDTARGTRIDPPFSKVEANPSGNNVFARNVTMKGTKLILGANQTRTNMAEVGCTNVSVGVVTS